MTENRTRLDALTGNLIILTMIVGLIHHTDHVFRVDHSGWPFISQVTPFTFSLLAYPALLFALFARSRLPWTSFGVIAIGTILTLAAHIFLESPEHQYSMWAANRSLDPNALPGTKNLLDTTSEFLGVLAVAISMALNFLLILTSLLLFRNARRDGSPKYQEAI